MHRFILLILVTFSINQGFSQCDTLQGEVRLRYFSDILIHQWVDPFIDLPYVDAFPNNPDYVRTLFALSTPTNYTDYYCSQIKGYIRTDVGGKVVFNVNADDTYSFQLSTDNTVGNLVTVNADTNATADLDTITLVAGQYYYFDLTHLERSGADFASVEWKGDFLTDGISATNWTTVGGDYIYNLCEPICENRGETCDDGDPNTENDQWDGNCNCTGNPITTNACVGERGLVQTYLYYDLPNEGITAVDNVIANTVQPDTAETIDGLFLETYYTTDGAMPNYGSYFQGFISVPMTGYYSFNITGSSQNIFYISSDDTPANKENNQLWTYWSASRYAHDVDYGTRPHDQTAENLLLEAGRYYYVELRHKGIDSPWQHFNLFWKTPYQAEDEWKRIPTFYFFDYTCETMCLKNGIDCNDNDPYTANDEWDGNCNCAGIPCAVPDCDDPTTAYNAPEECETTNLIDNRADDAWLSCAPLSDAPNMTRNGQHWIQYDLGSAYNLGTTQVWNYNVDGATASGFQQVVIDYSTDGINWQELGTYNWDLATGATDYEGFVGPDFTNITARYVLISSMDDAASCRGIHKISFNAVSCPRIEFSTPNIDQSLIANTDVSLVQVAVTDEEIAINSVALYLDNSWIADDNSAPYEWTDLAALQNLSNGDYKLAAIATDANGTACELSTQIHAIALTDFPCQSAAIVLDMTEEMVYRTQATITATGMIESNDPTFYIAEESITLMPGFHVMAGSEFTAMIVPCSTTPSSPLVQARNQKPTVDAHKIKLYPNPIVSNFTLEIEAYEAGMVQIRVFDVLGKELSDFNRQNTIPKGLSTIDIPSESLTAGLYYCNIKIGSQSFTKSFVRVDEK